MRTRVALNERANEWMGFVLGRDHGQNSAIDPTYGMDNSRALHNLLHHVRTFVFTFMIQQ